MNLWFLSPVALSWALTLKSCQIGPSKDSDRSGPSLGLPLTDLNEEAQWGEMELRSRPLENPHPTTDLNQNVCLGWLYPKSRSFISEGTGQSVHEIPWEWGWGRQFLIQMFGASKTPEVSLLMSKASLYWDGEWCCYSNKCVMGGWGCTSFRRESGSQVGSKDKGKPGLCFVFLSPLCSMRQEAQGESTHGLPSGCCQYCVKKNSLRTRKEIFVFIINNFNFLYSLCTFQISYNNYTTFMTKVII